MSRILSTFGSRLGLVSAAVVFCLLAASTGSLTSPPQEAETALHSPVAVSHSAQASGRGLVLPAAAEGLRLTAGNTASPFAVLSLQTGTNPVPAKSLQAQLEQNLHLYYLGGLEPEQKRQIKRSLRDLLRAPQGRALLVATFFADGQPQAAQAMYGLIRDAGVKDVGLLEDLIAAEHRATHAVFATRIVDLIADLGEQAHYSSRIDGYLAQLALHPDPQLRAQAASRRLWYLNLHQPQNLSAQEKYLFDASPQVREEVYSLIEARIAGHKLAGQTYLLPALNAALLAGPAGTSDAEKARLSALLQALGGTGA